MNENQNPSDDDLILRNTNHLLIKFFHQQEMSDILKITNLIKNDLSLKK